MYRLLTLLAATLLSAGALAQDTTKPTGPDPTMKTATFEALDRNKDQQISKTEAAADRKVSDSFAALDTNGDGYVSKSEFAARPKT